MPIVTWPEASSTARELRHMMDHLVRATVQATILEERTASTQVSVAEIYDRTATVDHALKKMVDVLTDIRKELAPHLKAPKKEPAPAGVPEPLETPEAEQAPPVEADMDTTLSRDIKQQLSDRNMTSKALSRALKLPEEVMKSKVNSMLKAGEIHRLPDSPKMLGLGPAPQTTDNTGAADEHNKGEDSERTA